MDDLISRQAAIDALTKDKKALEHIINEMSGREKEFDRFVGQHNQVERDIYAIEQMPPAQPKIIDGRLFVTVDDIKKVGCVLVDEHKSNFCRQFWMDGDGPEPCEDAVSRKTVKELMLKYGFLAPDMTVTEFVEDCLPPVTPKQSLDIEKVSKEVLNATSKWLSDQDDKRNVLDVIKDVLQPYKGKE